RPELEKRNMSVTCQASSIGARWKIGIARRREDVRSRGVEHCTSAVNWRTEGIEMRTLLRRWIHEVAELTFLLPKRGVRLSRRKPAPHLPMPAVVRERSVLPRLESHPETHDGLRPLALRNEARKGDELPWLTFQQRPPGSERCFVAA